MSLRTTISIHCDEVDCLEQFEGRMGERAPVVRRRARWQGWTRRYGRDYCPKHPAVRRGFATNGPGRVR